MASDNTEQQQPTSYWTVDPMKPVLLRMGKEGLAAEKPQTVPQGFMRTASEYPDHAALVYEDANTKEWTTVNYA